MVSQLVPYLYGNILRMVPDFAMVLWEFFSIPALNFNLVHGLRFDQIYGE